MVVKAQRQVPRGLLIGADDVFDAAQGVVLRGRDVAVGIGARDDLAKAQVAKTLIAFALFRRLDGLCPVDRTGSSQFVERHLRTVRLPPRDFPMTIHIQSKFALAR